MEKNRCNGGDAAKQWKSKKAAPKTGRQINQTKNKLGINTKKSVNEAV